MMPAAGTSIDAALTEYMGYLRIERGLAENSLLAYESDLQQLRRFLATARIVNVAQVEVEHLRGWLRDLADRGCGSTSVARKAAVAKGLWRYLAETRHVRDLGALLDPVRRGEKIPRTIDPAQTAKLVEVQATSGYLAQRDRAVMELLYACGLRVSELCNLRLPDVDLDSGFVRVIGKGNKERIVPMGLPAVRALREYIGGQRTKLLTKAKAKDTDLVFLSRTGGRLDRHNVFRMVQDRAERAGVTVPITPHSLRHCFATHLHAGGADLRVIQELCGHSSITTTEKYVHIDPSRLKAIHSKYHPLGGGQAQAALEAAEPRPDPGQGRRADRPAAGQQQAQNRPSTTRQQSSGVNRKLPGRSAGGGGHCQLPACVRGV